MDSSAVVALLLHEAGWEEVLGKLQSASAAGIGTPTLAETAIVLTAKLGPDAPSLLARFLVEANVTEVPFGTEHWRAAADAFARFGKGRHRAALNFGDCMAYAVAQLSGQPLLCVGEDFARTDLTLA